MSTTTPNGKPSGMTTKNDAEARVTSGTPLMVEGEDEKISNDVDEISRGNWTGKLDFILSCLSYAVGLGNVWRFPYQCYKNGGGAFLLPFLLMVGVIGVPMFFLESAFGQYASSGVVSIWKACPLFQGIGGAMFFVSFFVSIYYNVIIAWSFYYLIRSFTSSLPWATCDNTWNTPACRVGVGRGEAVCHAENGTWWNETCYTLNNTRPDVYSYVIEQKTNYSISMNISMQTSTWNQSHFRSPSEEYFHNHVLGISDGFTNPGSMRWELVACLLLSWFLVCVCMIKGIKTSGRAVYFTATFPYLVLLILMIRGLTLPGSLQGILFYITPRWSRLLSAQVWADAAVQIFFSLAPGWGGLITLSSYNKFKNNCLRDAYIVSLGDCLTSIFAGLVIFSILGYMAHELNTSVGNVADEGAGLAFVVYPEVVTRLPASPLWAIIFFLMLITLGLGTQFAIVNTVHTTIIDMFPNLLMKGRRPSYVMIGLCGVCFFLGLSCVTQGGMYMLQLLDSYSATYSVLFIALTESVVLAWVYGYERLVADIKLMLGQRISIYWRITWQFGCPIALVLIIVATCVEFKPTKYAEYFFPGWADVLGLLLTLSSIIWIPAVAAYKILFYKDKSLSLLQRILALVKPTSDWGPSIYVVEERSRSRHQSTTSEVSIPLNTVPVTVEKREGIST